MQRIGYQLLASQNLAVGSSSVASTAFAQTTRQVRLVSTADCYIAIGPSAVATTSSTFLPGGVVEYIQARPGDVVAAIQSTASGTLNITETGR